MKIQQTTTPEKYRFCYASMVCKFIAAVATNHISISKTEMPKSKIIGFFPSCFITR